MSRSPSVMKWRMPRSPRVESLRSDHPLPPLMPDTRSESDPLIFHWDKPGRKARGLAFWLFVVLLSLAAFFYLFQVVYPQAQRFTPVPHHIVALNASDPAA